MSSFLNLTDKCFLITGVANKKSIAYHVAKIVEKAGGHVIYSVRSEARKKTVEAFLGDQPIYVCDFDNQGACVELAESITQTYPRLDGILHSVAFADYSDGFLPFYETSREKFLQAATISAFSLVEMAHAFKFYLSSKASVVALSISDLELSAEQYGYMSPIKAALESCIRFLAKSFSHDTQVRFNCVKAGPLKTSASAGIPGYLDHYLYAEALTYRKKALNTEEVANTAVFLLSEASSGINGQGIVVDAGLGQNFFDQTIVDRFHQS